MKRKVLLQLVVPLLSLCVLFFLLATEPAGAMPRPLVELSVIFREQDAVWNTTRDGMERAAADLGAELRFLAPERPNDAEEQKLLLERELAGGADGVVLVPADRGLLQQPVKETKRVVITLETPMEDTDGYVGVDNAALGEAIARSAMNGVYRGRLAVLLDSVPGDNGVRDRMNAAKLLLEQEGRCVEQLVSTEKNSLPERLPAVLEQEEPAALLTFEASAMEDTAELIRTMNEEKAETHREPPLLYGTGSTSAIAAGLEQNQITAVHAQDDFSAGYIAVVTAVRAVRHQDAGSPELLPFLLVRRENMYDMDRQKLMFPVTR